jgi:putative PIN family toxin of toxin-antitoxin system
MNIVIDTNVIISGVKSRRGASFKIISQLNQNLFRFHISPALLFQYEASLKHSDFKSVWSDEEIDEFLDLICFFGIKHNVLLRYRPLLPDANDEFVAELAINAHADHIVTYNVSDFEPLHKFGITALTPQSFLQRLESLK